MRSSGSRNFCYTFVLAFIVLSFLYSCKPSPHTDSGNQLTPLPSPAVIQPKLVQISVGTYHVDAEIARTDEERSRGLMFRYRLPENQGMLFIFEKPGNHSFYMKNTFIPLSIAFISKEYRIVKIAHMNPLDETTYHYPSVPVKYALEMNQGWFQKRRIKAGTTVDLSNVLNSKNP